MMDIFGKKRKRIQKEKKEAEKTGIYIEDMPVADRKGYKLKNILLNGTINGIIVISSIMCVLEAFEVNYHQAVLIAAVMAICYFAAGFYVNLIWKIFGYIGIVAAFIYGILEYRIVLRGGFGTIANAFMEVIELELDLPIERRYSEFELNKVYAVTFCAIFICGALALLFNIVITESKGFSLVFFITFPFVQLGMYFNRDVSVPAFVAYAAGMVSLMVLRCSPHYKGETKRKNGYSMVRKKETYVYDYVSDSRNSFARMSIIIAAVLICIITVSLIIPKSSFRINSKTKGWKEDTQETAKRVALVGFWGMLNPNGSGTGGIGRNKLGQADHISLDYQKDLDVVTAVLKNEKDIYLRAYAGTTYEDNNWKYISESKPEGYRELKSYGLTINDVASLNYNILHLYNDNRLIDSFKKLMVYNTFANDMFSYIPANSLYTEEYLNKFKYDDEWNVGLNYGAGMTCNYYDLKELNLGQLEQLASEIKSKSEPADIFDIEEKYREYVYNTYLSVPDENKAVIDKIFREENITNEDGIDSVYKIISFLEDNYEYTLMPGKTPSGKDFVNYFLEENKKGYCTYFASSAVLMFRELGIPARYVGGYMVSTTDDDYMHEANQYNQEFWAESEQKEYNIYDIEVNDSDAHAWVEVYVNNLGWVTVEATPPSDEDEEEEDESGGIGEFLTNVFFNNQTAEAIKQTTIGTLTIIVLLVLLILLFFILMINILRHRRRKREDVEKNFRYLERVIKAAGFVWNNCRVFKELSEELIDCDLCSREDAEYLIKVLEKKRYSTENISKSEEMEINRIVMEISDNVYQRISLIKKIRYKYLF